MWIPRTLSEKIQSLAKTFPAILLTGARQVGKTSLLTHLFPDHSIATLDLPSNAELAEREPEEFLKRYPPPVVIDEVQYAPALFRYLKIAIDKHRDRFGQFILTGSQKFTLMNKVADSLAGRCAILELETLSFKESQAARNASEIEFIVRGGFPELHAIPSLDANAYYQSYVATYLERDVRTLLHVTQLRDFERFVRACALRNAQVLNKSDLARDVGISPVTANEWLSVLAASNQVVLLEPWFNNKTKSLIKSPKLYMADSGLLCYLLGIHDVQSLMKSPLAGAIWESFVFSEIRKQLKQGKHDIWLWRDHRGLEVDFIIHSGGRFTFIEAKFTESPNQRDEKSMNDIAALIGSKKITTRLIVARVQTSYPISETTRVIPITEIHQYIE